jgi:two-component system sensor histidine kinase FlrB
MLPSSHLAPINLPLADDPSDGQVYGGVEHLQIDGSSHRRNGSRDEFEMQARSAVLLAGEFSEFIAAATRLENSYRELQEEVSQLGLELSERNAALNTSLAENERMRQALQQIVDSMPCGVLVLDRDGQISMINPESRRLLVLDGAHFDTESKTTLRQISAWSGVNLEATYESASSSDTEQEFCVRGSTGKRWVEVRNRRLFRQSGRAGVPDKTILILRDITAQKRAEQEREAGRKAMALAEITTTLAHEIRNPLASLELFAGLIEKDGDRRGEWISHLRAGIRSLSGTVNNVLSFHGSGSLTLAPVVLSAVIDNAIQFVQPLADQAGVSLEWLAGHNQIRVMGNESALQQVVLNLVSNAIRHTPAGGNVTVSLRHGQSGAKGENHGEDSEHVVAEFSDTGCGIRPDQIDHIFEPGFSGNGDTSGLGLAVCERIIKQHGGRISAANCEHSGARFTLQFPVHQLELATA